MQYNVTAKTSLIYQDYWFNSYCITKLWIQMGMFCIVVELYWEVSATNVATPSSSHKVSPGTKNIRVIFTASSENWLLEDFRTHWQYNISF